MNLPFYIARRYLFSKKKHNAINIISAISVCGVALATMAMVCTLSVFNGFQDTVADLFTVFDPELKVTIAEGKVFDAQDPRIQAIRQMPEVDVLTETLEENAMVQYKDRQTMAVIKGVQNNFEQLTAIDSILYGAGEFLLNDSIVDYGVMGIELVSTLGTGIRFVDPLQIYIPKKGAERLIWRIRLLPLIWIICIRPALCLWSISRNMTDSIFLLRWILPDVCLTILPKCLQ